MKNPDLKLYKEPFYLFSISTFFRAFHIFIYLYFAMEVVLNIFVREVGIIEYFFSLYTYLLGRIIIYYFSFWFIGNILNFVLNYVELLFYNKREHMLFCSVATIVYCSFGASVILSDLISSIF